MIPRGNNCVPSLGAQAQATVIGQIAGLGMIMVRGDTTDPGMAIRLKDALDCKIPSICKVERHRSLEVAWMAPDELLVILPGEDLEACIATIKSSLQGTFCLVAEVSAMRVMFELTGDDLRDILAKEIPMDLSPESFNPGDFRRTRFGQVAVAVWLRSETRACLVCRSSESDYVEQLLNASARSDMRPGYLHNPDRPAG